MFMDVVRAGSNGARVELFDDDDDERRCLNRHDAGFGEDTMSLLKPCEGMLGFLHRRSFGRVLRCVKYPLRQRIPSRHDGELVGCPLVTNVVKTLRGFCDCFHEL